jgi:nitric oxide reductase subunit B
MKTNTPGTVFFMSALIMLMAGMFLGLISAMTYILPSFMKDIIGFSALRPMHVSSIMLWIILGATGCVYAGLDSIRPGMLSQRLIQWQWFLWMIAITGIFYSYFNGQFGGREYWEFNPVWSLPIALAWILFIFNFFRTMSGYKNWPVYVWMWMTGIVFFLFSFIENYLWIFPFFRDRMITDMTIQWKVNGSLVGAWNQILYGTVFFLMDRIDKTNETGRSKTAFAMYFLGLFNLMFNWGHHIYTLPGASYVRYIGYVVSMTEWVFFIRIIYQWRKNVSQASRHYHYFPYRFIMAADIWVLINMGQAILMSIPAFNLLTHGTHVTVAHAMGTTIGINTMILMAAGFALFTAKCQHFDKGNKILNIAFWTSQASLLVFWLSLNTAGVLKGLWQLGERHISYKEMMQSLTPCFATFLVSGLFLMVSLCIPAAVLLKSYISCHIGMPSHLQIKTKLTHVNH